MPNQNSAESADSKMDYSGYKVLTANWTESLISSNVENILLATNADLWSSREDIYGNHFIRFMIPGDTILELTSVLRKGFNLTSTKPRFSPPYWLDIA